MSHQYGYSFIKQFPILRLLIGLVLGILLDYYFKLPLFAVCLLSCVSFFCMIVYNRLGIVKQFAYYWLNGVAITVFFVCLGWLTCHFHNHQNHSNFLGKHYHVGNPVLVTLQETPIEKAKTYKCLVKAEALYRDKKWQPVEGTIILYIKKDSSPPTLAYGQQFIINNAIQPIEYRNNPGSFNFQQYCALQNIHYQCFAQSATIIKTPYYHKTWLWNWIVVMKHQVLQIIRSNILQQASASIAEALLIGYREDLDKDLLKAYSNTGVIHVIAISGLHIGMIYGLMVWLFSFVKSSKWKKLLKPVSILVVIWGFSLIAGAAPSILRSAVMFSFIVLGDVVSRKSSLLNNLALSAFFILLFNPYSLWDVGFQLSYTAVLSIILFSPYVKSWLFIQNKLLNKIWSLSAITISAQVLTLPIVLYNFHQFPTLFFITNFLIVPYSGLLIYAEIGLLLVNKVPMIGPLFGSMISKAIDLMNDYIIHMNRLPFAVWENISISSVQTWLLFIAICFTIAWLIRVKHQWLLIGLSAWLLLTMLLTLDKISHKKQLSLVVYNLAKVKAIDIFCGNRAFFFGDKPKEIKRYTMETQINPARLLNRVDKIEKLKFASTQSGTILSAGNRKICLIDSTTMIPKIKSGIKKIKVDYIIVSHNPKMMLSDLASVFEFKHIIIDGSNSRWRINRWKEEAVLNKLNLFIVTENGAFVAQL